MTDWAGFTAADFDLARAPKHVRRNAEAGQEDLFGAGTPTVPAKPAAKPEPIPGEVALFGDDDQEASD